MRIPILVGMTGILLSLSVAASHAEDGVQAATAPEAVAMAEPGDTGPAPVPAPIMTALNLPAPLIAPGTPRAEPARRPWCPSGRTVGSGSGFCLVN